jgi:hypothetical protein
MFTFGFKRSLPAILRGLLLAGAIALPVGGLAALGLQAASADTYCTASPPDDGIVAGILYDNWINVYTDPGCSGSRQVQYRYNDTASSPISIDIDSIRAWLCGVQSTPANPPPYYGTSTEWDSNWSPLNSCGFQADQSTYFGSPVNTWTYSHI